MKKYIPVDLLELKKRFEHWRSTRTGSNKTPSELMQGAVALSYKYGVNRVARPLGLNYTGLKAQRQKTKDSEAEAQLKAFNQTVSEVASKINLKPARVQARFVELTPRTSLETQVQPTRTVQIQIQGGFDRNLKIVLESPQPGDWDNLLTAYFKASLHSPVAR